MKISEEKLADFLNVANKMTYANKVALKSASLRPSSEDYHFEQGDLMYTLTNQFPPKEFAHFLRIAFGSGGELETQIEIAKGLPKTKELDFVPVEALLDEIMRMLNAMLSKASA